jgi:hypothetical protein
MELARGKPNLFGFMGKDESRAIDGAGRGAWTYFPQAVPAEPLRAGSSLNWFDFLSQAKGQRF